MRIYAPWRRDDCDGRSSARPIFGRGGGMDNGWDGHDESGSASKSIADVLMSVESEGSAVLIELQRPYDPGVRSDAYDIMHNNSNSSSPAQIQILIGHPTRCHAPGWDSPSRRARRCSHHPCSWYRTAAAMPVPDADEPRSGMANHNQQQQQQCQHTSHQDNTYRPTIHRQPPNRIEKCRSGFRVHGRRHRVDAAYTVPIRTVNCRSGSQVHHEGRRTSATCRVVNRVCFDNRRYGRVLQTTNRIS